MTARKTVYFLTIMFGLLAFSGCDSKWDKNGDLYGLWQLTEWRDNTNTVVATKNDCIYYCVQLNLIQFRQVNRTYYLAYFSHTGDNLTINRPVKQTTTDSLCSCTDLNKFGVPSDGIFHVDVLNDERMVLSSASQGTLSFRKY